jgi:hypothetical protein
LPIVLRTVRRVNCPLLNSLSQCRVVAEIQDYFSQAPEFLLGFHFRPSHPPCSIASMFFTSATLSVRLPCQYEPRGRRRCTVNLPVVEVFAFKAGLGKINIHIVKTRTFEFFNGCLIARSVSRQWA